MLEKSKFNSYSYKQKTRSMKERDENVIAVFHKKNCDFQDAIYNCSLLKGLSQFDNQNGDNDFDDRYWSTVFHKLKPDPTLNKETRLGFGFGGADYSVVFIFDHTTGKSLTIKGDFDPESKNSYKNACRFAKFFEEKNILVVQFTNRLLIHKINPETLEIENVIDSNDSLDKDRSYFKNIIKRMVFEKTGLDYFSFLDDQEHPGLIKFNFETKKIKFDGLPGYMTRFGLLYCLYIKELENGYPIAVLGISGTQKSDPDMGYSLFIQNGKQEDGYSLYNYKNEFFQNTHAESFTFEKARRKGYLQMSVYSNNKKLITRTIVPTNFDVTRNK